MTIENEIAIKEKEIENLKVALKEKRLRKLMELSSETVANKVGELFKMKFLLEHVHGRSVPMYCTDELMVDFKTFSFEEVDAAIEYLERIFVEYTK